MYHAVPMYRSTPRHRWVRNGSALGVTTGATEAGDISYRITLRDTYVDYMYMLYGQDLSAFVSRLALRDDPASERDRSPSRTPFYHTLKRDRSPSSCTPSYHTLRQEV